MIRLVHQPHWKIDEISPPVSYQVYQQDAEHYMHAKKGIQGREEEDKNKWLTYYILRYRWIWEKGSKLQK